MASQTWYAGTFGALPALNAELVAHVTSRPRAPSYTEPTAARRTAMNTMMASIFAALDRSLAHDDGDWCRAIADASSAGYSLQRLRDSGSGRWFLHGFDATAGGAAYFWIDPEPGRNIVVEAPHAGSDTGTDAEAGRMFLALAARALVVNGARRCTSPLASACTGTTSVCTGDSEAYRQSDVTHDVDSGFHAIHVALDDRYVARFVQLHQNSSSGQLVIAADGTLNRANPLSPSVTFARALGPLVDVGRRSGSVTSCQSGETALCATYNTAGRYTNRAVDSCTGARVASIEQGRFLHIEQDSTMTDNNCERRGRCWTSVRDALLATWGAPCAFNNCTLGPAQAAVAGSTCGTDAGVDATVDSSVVDSSVIDTTVVDTTAIDTTVVDTTAVDTTVVDTTVVDTAVVDSATDSAAVTTLVTCSQLTVTAGTVSNAATACGATGTLATVDERVAEWSASLSGVKTSAYATYRSPAPAASLKSLRLIVTYLGDDGTEPLWTWSVRNLSGGWDVIGDSSAAANWSWRTLTFTIPNPAGHVNAAGDIDVRFTSATSTNSAELDRMVVEVTQ